MSSEEEPKLAVTGVVTGDATPMSEQKKQGAKCCGCCCDYRRATIVVAIIQLIASSIWFILSLTGVTLADAGGTIGYDENGNPVDAVEVAIILAIGYAVVFIVYIIQIVAAVKYSKCWLCIALFLNFCVWGFYLFSIWAQYWTVNLTNFCVGTVLTIIFGALWIYPIVGLIVEMNKGIMSKETYPREAYSCCCAPTV